MLKNITKRFSSRGPIVNATSPDNSTTQPETGTVSPNNATEALKSDVSMAMDAPKGVDSPPVPPKDEISTTEPIQAVVSETAPPEAIPERAKPANLIPTAPTRRLSFSSLQFFYGRDRKQPEAPTDPAKPEPSKEQTHTAAKPEEKKVAVKPEVEEPKPRKRVTKSDKRAMESATVLRTVILGPAANPNGAKLSKKQTELKSLKSELFNPSMANRIIASLRSLPLPSVPFSTATPTDAGKKAKQETTRRPAATPIHAVCLDCTDEEAEARHFAHLTAVDVECDATSGPSVASASLSSLVPTLEQLKLVNLMSAPDFGFGQPPGGEGLLAGSVPSASQVADGISLMGQQLLALGFATSQAVLPSHEGIYPPTDRMSCITYWWGYEIVFPPPSMSYLGNVKSISNALLNFLTAFSLINTGVREILPFIRYTAQFVEFEWNAIKAQDKGKGVVCAATWVMPAALVPRSWDFSDPPGSPPRAVAVMDNGADGPKVGMQIPMGPGEVSDPPTLTITPATLPRGGGAGGVAITA